MVNNCIFNLIAIFLIICLDFARTIGRVCLANVNIGINSFFS